MGSNPENNNAGPPAIAGALTYPARDEENLEPLPVQPRQPRNLQGLLRFAMDATKEEDAPGNSNFTAMDEERKRFLEEALKNLTVDVAEVLQESIKTLTDRELIMSFKVDDPLTEAVVNSFGNIMEFIDDIDVANDFYKLGGFEIFPVCFSSESAEVRWRASWVLAEVCQNNPPWQARALDGGLLGVLLTLLPIEQGKALAKCIYAISCICREFPAGARALVSRGGCGALAGALSSPDAAARTKAAFLVRYLCADQPQAREKFIEENLVKIVTEQIKTSREQTAEHMLNLLLTLVDLQDPRVLHQCKDPALGLQQALKEAARDEELRMTCHELMRKIFGSVPLPEVHEEAADR